MNPFCAVSPSQSRAEEHSLPLTGAVREILLASLWLSPGLHLYLCVCVCVCVGVTEWQVRFFQPGSPVLVHQVTVTVQRAAIPSGV